jgi:hypothetical protein
MLIFRIYVTGMFFLAGAIGINVLAKRLGLPSWYDFLQKPELTLTSGLWLFIGYPFMLGGLVWLIGRWIK